MTAQLLGVRLGVAVVILLALPIGLYALAFQFLGIGDPTFHERFARLPWAAMAHLLGGGVALLIGGFQFVERIRRTAPNWHRFLGRIYLCLVLAGGIGGGLLSFQADGGLVGRVGFFVLAVLWLWSGAAAYRAIRRGDIVAHRRWMMRNYALTFAAVTLRIQLGVMAEWLGYGFDAVYPLVAWSSWVPNLIFVEWVLLATSRPAHAATS